MNILLVQDHLRAGGAARAAGRWAGLLRSQGYRVVQLAGDEAGPEAVRLTGKPPRGIGRLRELWSGTRASRQKRVREDFDKLLGENSWDLVWFHNLAGGEKWGWSEALIGMARTRAPVVWTLHDMWALGDSSQSYWQEDQVGEREKWKRASVERSRVQRVGGVSGEFPVKLTAPSRWLAELTKKTTGKECKSLSNPIDLKLFSPGDRREARLRLGLPEKGRLILAGADSLQDRRKGLDLLEDAWSRHRPPDCTLVLFGRHGHAQPGQIHLGSLREENGLVAAYQAADLYVHPARQENAPCTIQESLACGTPVLAFGVGGIPEMIRPGQTGYLVGQVDALALADGLGKVLRDTRQLEAMRSECRQLAERDYSPAVLLEEFRRLCPGSAR